MPRAAHAHVVTIRLPVLLLGILLSGCAAPGPGGTVTVTTTASAAPPSLDFDASDWGSPVVIARSSGMMAFRFGLVAADDRCHVVLFNYDHYDADFHIQFNRTTGPAGAGPPAIPDGAAWAKLATDLFNKTGLQVIVDPDYLSGWHGWLLDPPACSALMEQLGRAEASLRPFDASATEGIDLGHTVMWLRGATASFGYTPAGTGWDVADAALANATRSPP